MLFDHTRCLENVILDNEGILAVSNTEVNYVDLYFDAPDGYNFITCVSDSLFGELKYSGDDSFMAITNDYGGQAFYGIQPTMSGETFMEWNFSL